MKIKELALGTLSRILRYAGILLLIYISMVFYLALTERRNAFPRAITHNEARTAIADKARAINCTLDDGTKLEGFVVGNEQNNVLLYYPDADEDAAQFLAELDSLPGFAAATFNYRGSGENKGTPSQETFESDAQMIYECASQINGNAPKVVAGRGTGAILATKMAKKENITILIDPVWSIADAISDKYRLLYPKFLVRADVKIEKKDISTSNNIVILLDRARYNDRTSSIKQALEGVNLSKRGSKSLSEAIFNVILRK
ncbi:alpha/beta hydrolase [Fibrobacter sp. UBA4297]|uniref:alpha/beta hydrolase n=1 Tax=Fibrobacter sp. UBA4297 TaxID=1946536 RepID=UPI0025BE978B|nr:alpha/beta hydrolase [Fibrobacter sp. UBA4297]